MDAPILMATMERPIRFACHHYMGQVPVMREIVTGQFGCFPWSSEHRQQGFSAGDSADADFSGGWGVSRGTKPMVQFTQPNQMNEFQGFPI